MTQASFNVEEMTNLIFNNNKDSINKFKKISEICAKDPILRNDPADYGKGRLQTYELYAKKVHRFHKLFNFDETSSEYAIQLFPEQMNCLLHVKMFMPTIKFLGSEKQIEKWIPLAQNYDIIGCYAQTEIAHGSDVQSLETEAIYDVEHEEFIIHSPSITACKWWIGDLGITATHCVTQAQLICGGKRHGVQTFIVPLRDPQTYKCHPGIKAGDVGPKYGYNNNPNGYLMFDNIRIPRENMLMRYAKVNKNGEFQKSQNEKIGYATMMTVRTFIIKACYNSYSTGLTIAIRYSHTRTQFKTEQGIERPIIDYQVQMDKILPLLAECYAQCFASHRVEWLTNDNIKRVTERMDFSQMQDLHALISCCKAIFTWQTHFGLEKLRQSCGGHGYSAYSRFPSLISEFAPTCTYEGDNTVLLLQCARYLLKALQKATRGAAVNENVEYLVNIEQTLSQTCIIERTSQLFCPDIVRKILRHNAAYQVKEAANKLMMTVQEHEVSPKEAWDKHAGIALQDASIAHNYYWTMKTFQDQLSHTSDESVRTVLARLACLFGISKILERTNSYFESGYMKGDQLEIFFEAKEILLEQIKQDSRGLVDAFILSDNQLFSALIYPDPYQKLFEWASLSNPINKPEVQKELYDSYRGIMGNLPKAKF